MVNYGSTTNRRYTPGYEWVKQYIDEDEEVRTILKVSTVAGLQTEKKYKFGLKYLGTQNMPWNWTNRVEPMVGLSQYN